MCVTGAGSGIGRAIAIAMSNEGYNVTCADINLKQANETLEIILNSNGSGISIKTDVTKNNDIENIIRIRPTDYSWEYKRFKRNKTDSRDPYINI